MLANALESTRCSLAHSHTNTNTLTQRRHANCEERQTDKQRISMKVALGLRKVGSLGCKLSAHIAYLIVRLNSQPHTLTHTVWATACALFNCQHQRVAAAAAGLILLKLRASWAESGVASQPFSLNGLTSTPLLLLLLTCTRANKLTSLSSASDWHSRVCSHTFVFNIEGVCRLKCIASSLCSHTSRIILKSSK